MVGETVGTVEFEHWSRLVYWSLPEAVALCEGRDPDLIGESEYVTSKKTNDLVKRAVEAGLLTDPVLPPDFVDWARSIGLPVPEELCQLVIPQWVDWQAEAKRLRAESERLNDAFEYQKNELARRNLRIRELGGDIEKLRETAARQAEVGPAVEQGNAKRYNTLLKLVGGMAMAVYGFNPELLRSSLVSDIQNDLDLKGINLDADTIRKKLKEASKLIQSAENRNSKPTQAGSSNFGHIFRR